MAMRTDSEVAGISPDNGENGRNQGNVKRSGRRKDGRYQPDRVRDTRNRAVAQCHLIGKAVR